MCADGDPADAQTEEGAEMEKDPQAGAQGRYRAQTTVSHSALTAICRSSARRWSTGLLGLSKRPGGRLETTAGSRLGIRSRYPFGRARTIGQDMRLETGVYLRYQRPFLVPEFRRAIDLGRDRTIWCRGKGGWRGDAHIAVRSRSAPIECIIGWCD